MTKENKKKVKRCERCGVILTDKNRSQFFDNLCYKCGEEKEEADRAQQDSWAQQDAMEDGEAF